MPIEQTRKLRHQKMKQVTQGKALESGGAGTQQNDRRQWVPNSTTTPHRAALHISRATASKDAHPGDRGKARAEVLGMDANCSTHPPCQF